MKTQIENVRSHLMTYGKITSWDAIKEYRITRLSHYIMLLRKEGYDITMKRIITLEGNWYGLYILNQTKKINIMKKLTILLLAVISLISTSCATTKNKNEMLWTIIF